MSTEASNWSEAMMQNWAEIQKKYWETMTDWAGKSGGNGLGGFGTANPFTQNPFTQNPFTQNPFTQNPFTQNPFTQNPFTQNAFGQNPFTQNPFAAFGAGSNPFTGGLEQWWSKVVPATNGDFGEITQRFQEMGKTFMSMAEGVLNSTQSEHPGLGMEMWMTSIEQMLQFWISQIQSNADVMMPDLPGVSGTTLNTWARFADSVAPWLNMSQGVLKEAAEGHLPGGIEMPGMGAAQEQFCRALSMPGLGYNREQQEKLQALARHLVDYHEALRAYKLAFAKTALSSIEAVHGKVREIRQEGKKVESLRALYDLWVDISEQVYGEFAMTDEYQVVYGDLVNSLMRVRKDMNDMAEQQYRLMNLPTRSEIDTMQHRQQEHRRDGHRLRMQVKELQAAVEALSKQVAGGPTAGAAATAKRPVPGASEPQPDLDAEDDLTAIKGVGPRMAEKLFEQGIRNFNQLAALNAEMAKQLDAAVKAQGRLLRDNWIDQAKDLAK